jgi:hypothetical protein
MADYKFALKLHQDKTGSENAKAKISIGGTVVAAEVEIAPESATLYSYDVTGLADTVNIDNSVTTLVKVELLNDLYVDSDNDRNIIWSGCGYVQKNDDGNYYSQTVTTEDSWESDDQQADGGVVGDVVEISDFTADASFNWAMGGPHTGDPTGPDGDYSEGWVPLTVNNDYVQATIPLTEVKAMTYVDNS